MKLIDKVKHVAKSLGLSLHDLDSNEIRTVKAIIRQGNNKGKRICYALHVEQIESNIHAIEAAIKVTNKKRIYPHATYTFTWDMRYAYAA